MALQVLPYPYKANDTDSDRSPTNGVIPWMNLRIPLVVLLRNLSGDRPHDEHIADISKSPRIG